MFAGLCAAGKVFRSPAAYDDVSVISLDSVSHPAHVNSYKSTGCAHYARESGVKTNNQQTHWTNSTSKPASLFSL